MLRSLLRDKLYTLINLAGLSLAIASCIVLGLYLRSELTYDRHHVDHDRIYRVATEFKANGRSERVALASGLLAPMLAEEFADVQAFVRFTPPGSWTTATDRVIRHGEDAFTWADVYVADPNVFEVFTHEILYGDPKTALVDPLSAAVSRTFARKYFGDANPLGEVITLDNGEQRTITLVFADLPPNTHLKYDALFSYNGVVLPQDAAGRAMALFGGNNFTYLVLPESYDVRRFTRVAETFYERHMAARGRELHAEGWSAWLEPLADIHLYSNVSWDKPKGNRYYLYGLEAAVAFLLLIACINHVNLATASAARRAREIGTRKILGATRRALALRFIGESLCLSIAAVVVSLALVELVVPRTPIADWLGTAVSLRPASEPVVLAATVGFSLLVGLLAGLYPAFYLAAIPPLTAMTRGDKLGGSGLRLRELLVLVQFTVTACVIACTLLMASQMRYVANRPLGFEEEGRLVGDQRLAIIVNEALVRHMGWTESIGKRMGLRGRTVIGVVRDFNFKSLHMPVEPLVMYQDATNFANIPPEQRAFQMKYLVINVATRDLSGTLAYIEDTLRKFDPEHPFEYRFLDEALGRQYSSEQHLMRLIGVFSAICILVACLGLFGLATFTTARRAKEIGIRKVLGATTSQIVALLSGRTVLLVAIGSVLASALAYVAMDRWLEAFAYRVDVDPAPFVVAAAISLAVAVGTVALQSLGAARARPVHSLRQD